ncbi:MAG: hypothetical protein WCI31_15245 [Prolixibacteraceae bacterium]
MKKIINIFIFSVIVTACGTNQQKPGKAETVKTESISADTIKKAPANELGMWKIANYASNLGNNRNTSYITNAFAIWGTFTDNANDKAELKVKFVIDKETFCIKLLLYGNTPVKKGDETQYKITVKSSSGEIIDFTAKNVSDRIFIKSSDAQKIESFFNSGGKISFYLVTDSKNSPASYSFTLDGPHGFSEAIKKIAQ